jgi:hypothetical protein
MFIPDPRSLFFPSRIPDSRSKEKFDAGVNYNLPPVSTTPAANFATGTAGVVYAGSKLPPMSTTPVANNGDNIILLTH